LILGLRFVALQQGRAAERLLQSLDQILLGLGRDVVVVVAVSAPAALAGRMAETCGMTLVAVARKDGFEIFTLAGSRASSRLTLREPHCGHLLAAIGNVGLMLDDS